MIEPASRGILAGRFYQVLCPFKRFPAVCAGYIDLSGCPYDGAAAGADIFDAAVDGFLAPAFGDSGGLQAAGVDAGIPQIHVSASGVRVVTVQPYLGCFSICRPWASAVALNFILW